MFVNRCAKNFFNDVRDILHYRPAKMSGHGRNRSVVSKKKENVADVDQKVKGRNGKKARSEVEMKKVSGKDSKNSKSAVDLRKGKPRSSASRGQSPSTKPKTLSQIKNNVKAVREKQVSAVGNAIAKRSEYKKSNKNDTPTVEEAREVIARAKKIVAKKPKTKQVQNVESSDESDNELSNAEADSESSVSDEEDSDRGGPTSSGKSKKFRDKELQVLLDMCFKYYGVIEGNLSNASNGLTKEKKDKTWKYICDHVNR